MITLISPAPPQPKHCAPGVTSRRTALAAIPLYRSRQRAVPQPVARLHRGQGVPPAGHRPALHGAPRRAAAAALRPRRALCGEALGWAGRCRGGGGGAGTHADGLFDGEWGAGGKRSRGNVCMRAGLSRQGWIPLFPLTWRAAPSPYPRPPPCPSPGSLAAPALPPALYSAAASRAQPAPQVRRLCRCFHAPKHPSMQCRACRCLSTA